MKKSILSFALIVMTAFSVNAQTIFGKWKNVDEDTGKINSIVEVYKKDGKAYAKILELTDPKRKDAVCDKCEGDKKNKPIVGMDILSGLEKDGDEWNGGKILDPKNGKVYKCYIKLVNKNKLKIRGYLGFSLLGRTVYWVRN
ncbi:MAG: hypothetical protein CR961_01290 [Polaribacter sp.]|nr:MAG: hypothetical protein CR961_01290 [Polaribacter sp.]